MAKKPALKKMEMTPIDNVRNPNFDSALAQQDYMNTLAQLIADRQARGAAPDLMPIGGTEISAVEMQNLSPERRMALEQRMAAPQGVPVVQQPVVPMVGYAGGPNPAMNPMANYNKMLNQGMQRNQDMNQAAQNLAAPAGPVRSFSQMAGGTRRARRMPQQPRNNFLAPNNQKLI